MPVDENTPTEGVPLATVDAALLGDVLAHPFQLPSLPELVFMNHEHGREKIERRVETLVERGILEVVDFEDGAPAEEFPDTFYGITEFGRTVFFRRVPDDREQKLQTAYAAVDKPDSITYYERAPRPPRR